MIDRLLRSAVIASACTVWLLSLVLVAGCINRQSDPNSPSTPEPARPAEPKPKPVLLCFWEPWCGPCLRAVAHEKQLAIKYGDRVEFVGVSADDDGGKARALGMTWRQINGAEARSLYLRLRVSAVPTWVLVTELENDRIWEPVYVHGPGEIDAAIERALQ